MSKPDRQGQISGPRWLSGLALALAAAVLGAVAGMGLLTLIDRYLPAARAPDYYRFYALGLAAVLALIIARLLHHLSVRRVRRRFLAPLEMRTDFLSRAARDRNFSARVMPAEPLRAMDDALNGLLATAEQRETHLRDHRRLLSERLSQLSQEIQDLKQQVRQEVQQRRRVQSEAAKLSGALTHAADAVMVTNCDGEIEYVNPAFESITGYQREEVLGAKPDILKSGEHDQQFFAGMWKTMLAGEIFRDVVINRRKDGSLYHEEKSITPLKDSRGNITHFISTGKDITDRIRVQEELHYMAHHDAITGLPNRVMLMERIEQAMVRARRSGKGVSILFLDLDGFKAINDTVGHHVGDRFLAEVASRLQACLKDEDTVARLGGDEFAVVLDGLHAMTGVSKVARKLLRQLAMPFLVDGLDLYVTASIGVARYPSDGEDVHTLLRKADSAMYRAKHAGKNTHKFFSQVEGQEDLKRLELEQQLRRAVERNEFELVYQPQVSIDTSRVVGVEALLRWRHPERGLVTPHEFIDVLEETGLILEMGDWIIHESCRQVARWQDRGLPPLRVAVNLSSRQFLRRDLVGSVARVLDDTGLSPRFLNIEITEGTLARKFETTIETLNKLNALGITISVDDFGVGYSSLNYLKRFPIHKLKIDQSFVRDVTHDADDAAIVSAIIALAHNLRLEVIAEGVETLDQMFFLSRHGCHEVQGHLVSTPLTADAFVDWYRANPRVRAKRVANA